MKNAGTKISRLSGPETSGPSDLPHDRFPANSMSRSVHMKDDTTHCISETQTVKSQKSYLLGMSDRTSSVSKYVDSREEFSILLKKKKYQKLSSELKKTTDEQHDQSNICGQNIQKIPFIQIIEVCSYIGCGLWC